MAQTVRKEVSALVWPRALEFPSDEIRVVYLDLHHWISLAQASISHPKGSPFVKALAACRAARLAGTAVFVLSSSHYQEILKIKDPGAVVRVAEKRATEEREQALRLDREDRWRRGRLHDLISARELIIEFENILPRVLAERGLTLAEVIRDRESARSGSLNAEYCRLNRIENCVASKRRKALDRE